MSKFTKIILLITVIICIVGSILLGIGYVGGGLQFFAKADANGTNYDSLKVYSMEKTRLEDFSNINIDCSDMDLEILPSNDSFCYLTYELHSNKKENPFQYSVQNGTLTIKESSGLRSGTFIHINYGFLARLFIDGFSVDDDIDYENTATLYIPVGKTMDAAAISLGDGDLNINNFSSKQLNLELSFGDSVLTNTTMDESEITLGDGDLIVNQFTGQKLKMVLSFGDLILKNSSVADIDFNLSDGDLSINHLTAQNTNIQSSYGDVQLNNSSLHQMTAKMDDGDLTMNNTLVTGQSNLTLSYGEADVKLKEEQIDTLSLQLSTSYGEISVPSKYKGSSYGYDDDSLTKYNQTGIDPNASLTINCSDGDITLS